MIGTIGTTTGRTEAGDARPHGGRVPHPTDPPAGSIAESSAAPHAARSAGSGAVVSSGARPARCWVTRPGGWARRRGATTSTAGAPADAGMATAEYAIATVAAAGFAGLLVVILRSGEVRELLLGIIRSALSV